MYYAGIDYHKKFSQVSIVDEKNRPIWEGQLENSVEAFQNLRAELPPGECRAAFEAGRTWGVMFDLLEKSGFDAIVAHAAKLRPIAETHFKTDKRDADIIAQLLRADLIPKIHIPSKEIRSQRNILRQRIWLIRLRTMAKNRVYQLIDRNHIQTPEYSDLFGVRGRTWLKSLELPAPDNDLLRQHMELIEFINGQVRETEAWIEEELKDSKIRQLLYTLPGLGKILAATAALEIDRIDRFPTKCRFLAYVGVVPSTHASGGKVFHGRTISGCNHFLRYCFVEGAWTAIKTSPYFRGFYLRLKARVGSNKAIVATARKMAEIAWDCLKENRSYEERPYQFKARAALQVV